MSKYTHLELNNEMSVIAGYYVPQKEVRLKYNGGEILYIVGQANIDNACCANGCLAYALVPGYIKTWQGEKNEDGMPVTEVEPVKDKADRSGIIKMIKERETVSQVDFW